MTSDRASITVRINGQPVETAATTLADLLVEQGFGAVKVATAVNQDFVAERARAATPVKVGDTIEVVTARQGG